jgi:GH24 family phage-related lysozyme (muramidase)
MISRRAALSSTIALLYAAGARAQSSVFETLLQQALSQPEAMEKALALREGPEIEFDAVATRAVAPRYKPSNVRVSDDTVRMIIATEVSSQARYDQRYQSPLWPGGRSGVTIGIGYDVGYATADWIKEDWAGIIPDVDLTQLQKACKVTGTSAEALIKSLASIRVPWDAAYKQFATTALPRWTAETIGNVPNAEKLPPDCLGALVSIDYNRGPAWKLLDDRHKEMRAIRLHMVNEDQVLIPAEIRSMARLWANEPGMAGLVIRRNLEAALFEKGLKST